MKKLLLLIIFCLYLLPIYGNYNNLYSNHHNSYNSVSAEQTYRRIGYTTNYSNGQFNSTQYYQGTYKQSCYNGRPDQPRRVIIKHGNDSIDTGRDDDYNEKWNYYHGSVFGIGFDERWYYKDGDDMYFWNENKWEHTGRWDWVHTHKPADARKSVPIGDSIVPFLTILLLYSMALKRSSIFLFLYIRKIY